MKRIHWLPGVILLVAAFAVWRGALYVPAPGVAGNIPQPARAEPTASEPATAESDYTLADDEVIRFIPAPDDELRRRLLGQLGIQLRSDDTHIEAVTFIWDGALRFDSIQSGTGLRPRRLLDVLTNSLKVPLHRLDGMDVARQIGLRGDWIIRADADLDQCMSYLEQVVQRSGHPGFRVVRKSRKCQAHDMHGAAHAPEQPIDIVRPHPDVPPARVRTGTLREFGAVLSAAIQRPVSIHAEPQDIKVTWRDISRPYLDLGHNITAEMVAELLKEVSAALGVTFTDSEVETTVWRLEIEPRGRTGR
jgi:hypothetical protein